MNRIKELRKEKGLTLDDIQSQTGIKRGTYNNYENGTTNPKPETWQALANFFDVSVPYLQGATTYEVLDSAEKDIYNYVFEAMDRAFNDCALLPVQQERILKAIAYSIDNGELN